MSLIVAGAVVLTVVGVEVGEGVDNVVEGVVVAVDAEVDGVDAIVVVLTGGTNDGAVVVIMDGDPGETHAETKITDNSVKMKIDFFTGFMPLP